MFNEAIVAAQKSVLAQCNETPAADHSKLLASKPNEKVRLFIQLIKFIQGKISEPTII